MKQPEVSMLMIHYQTEAGDYWELGVLFWRETKQHAITRSSLEKLFNSASLLMLYGQPLMRLWYAVPPSVMSLDEMSHWDVLAHL